MDCLQKYKDIFQKKNIRFSLLKNDEKDIERLLSLLIKIDSPYLYPKDQNISLQVYSKKLINSAFNFILQYKNSDIGVLSIYANDFINKTAFTSSMGISPSQRGGKIAHLLVKFGIEFSKEIGMDFLRAEVDKENSKMVAFLKRYNFQIESETYRKSYILVNNLKTT